jgi:hypothetical protein
MAFRLIEAAQKRWPAVDAPHLDAAVAFRTEHVERAG